MLVKCLHFTVFREFLNLKSSTSINIYKYLVDLNSYWENHFDLLYLLNEYVNIRLIHSILFHEHFDRKKKL